MTLSERATTESITQRFDFSFLVDGFAGQTVSTNSRTTSSKSNRRKNLERQPETGCARRVGETSGIGLRVGPARGTDSPRATLGNCSLEGTIDADKQPVRQGPRL
jgi:hypothetical protein